MVEEETRVVMFQDYMTSAIKILAESYVRCHGGELNLPSFIEMTHENVKKETAQDILDHVRELFA